MLCPAQVVVTGLECVANDGEKLDVHIFLASYLKDLLVKYGNKTKNYVWLRKVKLKTHNLAAAKLMKH